MSGTFQIMTENCPEECMGCGSLEVRISFDPRYKGLRGSCTTCGGNWPES